MYSSFKYDIWAADLAKIGSLSSKNWGVKYLLCMIDAFTKYACVEPARHKKAKAVFHDFIEIVNESKRKPNKSWTDPGR